MESLRARSETKEYGNRRIPTVTDEALLAWAKEQALSPWEAQRAALESGILPLRYLKNLWGISMEEQAKLARSSVFVCGCGGLGGTILQLLVRAGVGRLRFSDPDVFDPTNLNRQWFSSASTLGRSKAESAARLCRTINPLVKLEPCSDPVTESTLPSLIREMDVIVDALDNLPTRFLLQEAAKRRDIPYVHGAVAGWLGQLTTFLPDSPLNLSDIYGSRHERDPAERDLGVLGPTAAVIGSLQAMESLRILLGKPAAYADHLLYYDGETGSFHRVPLASSACKD